MGERAKKVLKRIKSKNWNPMYRVQGQRPSPESLPVQKKKDGSTQKIDLLKQGGLSTEV